MSKRSMVAAVLLGVAVVVVMSNGARADWVSAVSASNPLNWWQFEEEAGATTADDVGSADNDGTYTGDVALGQPGLVGLAAGFDGANEVADYVLVGAADLPTDWTLEVIFKAGEGGASQGLIGGANTAVKAEQWNDTMSLGYTDFGVVDVTLPVATPSRYTYIALVGTAAGVDAYVSGALVASDATTMPLSRDVIGGGRLNTDPVALVDQLDGMIDELVIYDRALSSGEIMDHFRNIPEPGSLTLLLLGGMGLLAVALRRTR